MNTVRKRFRIILRFLGLGRWGAKSPIQKPSEPPPLPPLEFPMVENYVPRKFFSVEEKASNLYLQEEYGHLTKDEVFAGLHSLGFRDPTGRPWKICRDSKSWQFYQGPDGKWITGTPPGRISPKALTD